MNRMLYIVVLFFISQSSLAQSIGIGTNMPDASAKLEVSSTSQGLLIPVLTSAQRSTVANPATGLMVYQTDGTPGYCYYNGAAWVHCTRGYMLNNQGIALSFKYGITATFAGSGLEGAANGTGTTASFDSPAGVAVDASGNIYVADAGNHLVRKISAAGVVTTLAGSGSAGFADGTGVAASFDQPSGIAVDGDGNVYVADFFNHSIRKITPAGVVTTLAGSGAMGNVDGTGSSASFNFPYGVAVDNDNNVYVADRSNNRIRKITAAGVVTTFAGSGASGSADGTGTAASFNFPAAVAVDAAGNVYVADYNNHKVRKITASGAVSTLAGSGTSGYTDGAGAAASFNYPTGIATDISGNVYVTDLGNNRIRKITPNGMVTTLAGSGAAGAVDGLRLAASFNFPIGIATDTRGHVYVADNSNHRIRKIIAY